MNGPRTSAFGKAIIDKIEALACISETNDGLTRLFLSQEHRRAAELLIRWMRDAGMAARMDAVGNVTGRYEAAQPGRPALLLGSHFDTVRNAGKWDGPLGVITAIACVERLHRADRRMPFAIEIAAFADEEGTRFSSTLLGSRAFAGRWDNTVLAATDRSGARMDAAMRTFGLDPANIPSAARAASDYLAYIELHIEQGPVLEASNVPVGIVTGISGATRLKIILNGMAGHAGTVPMGMRRDALAGAAECIVMVEEHCRGDARLFGTVGQIEAAPGATNVIPGSATFSLDLRSISDEIRKHALETITQRVHEIARRRRLAAVIETTHNHETTACAPWLRTQISDSIRRLGYPVVKMPSGAGHDAMAIADLTDVGMIFVRCREGISHHPDEHVSRADVEAGAYVLFDLIENFQPAVAG